MQCRECEKDVVETYDQVCTQCLYKAYLKLKEILWSEELRKVFRE